MLKKLRLAGIRTYCNQSHWFLRPMLIQPTLQRLMLQTRLLHSFLVYLASINFIPRFNKFIIGYINVVVISIIRGIIAARMNSSFPFYNVLYYKIQHTYMVSLCHLVNRGFQLPRVKHAHCCISGTYNLSAAHSF